ncbi:TRAP transporter permease [Virgibacillus sp. W0181]|uniref:TRAP transporter permease n=1 Tax=Virgibacillus sp. W0181 TaxID=3391581 RepID=UPI003F44AE98
MTQSITKTVKVLLVIVAVLLAIFHLYTAYFGTFPGLIQRSVHWGGVLLAIFLLPLTKLDKLSGGKNIFIIIGSVVFVALSAVTSLYLVINYEDILVRIGSYTSVDMVLGIIAVILLLEATRRALGWALPIITILFILYAFLGPYIPGMAGHSGITFERFFTTMYLTSNGIYGIALGVAATFIYLFIFFGSILNRTGAGNFFVDVALSTTGRVSGGPALSAVLASALMGSISGSGVANVATTGNFTIPLMKNTGYKPHFAGAVEAIASNGGQILPPVMGAAVFLMAEILGIPYLTIAVAAIIPAILYFITTGFVVYLQAKKENIRPLDKENIPSFKKTMKRGFYYLIPLIVIIYFLAAGFSPMRAAFYGIVSVIVIGFVNKKIKFNFKILSEASYSALKSAITVSSACACAGIIIGVVSLSGLGLKMSSLIVSMSNGIVWIALIITMLVSIIMGMGLPTSAAYLILAVLGGPALIDMGVSPIAAHLFILYFGCLSTITPPVALSSFAAAGIAGSHPMRTGVESFRLAIVAFIIPYMFVYGPALLMDGVWYDIVIKTIIAIIGCFFIATTVIGWLGGKLHFILRIIIFGIAISLLHPSYITSLTGIGLLTVILVLNKYIFNNRDTLNSITNTKANIK